MSTAPMSAYKAEWIITSDTLLMMSGRLLVHGIKIERLNGSPSNPDGSVLKASVIN